MFPGLPTKPVGQFSEKEISYNRGLGYLINIWVTNTSVNPSRSTGVALFAGGWAINQLWLFWVAPIVGSILGAIVYRFIGSKS